LRNKAGCGTRCGKSRFSSMKKALKRLCFGLSAWRRVRDLNPSTVLAVTRFPIVRLRPLSQLSIGLPGRNGRIILSPGCVVNSFLRLRADFPFRTIFLKTVDKRADSGIIKKILWKPMPKTASGGDPLMKRKLRSPRCKAGVLLPKRRCSPLRLQGFSLWNRKIL
jgi:hypothetical protein